MNNNSITFSLEKSINDQGDPAKMYYNFLKFPKYDRVILSNHSKVNSWRISNGEFEKGIISLQNPSSHQASLRIEEYGNSKEYFIVHKRVFEKRNVDSIGPSSVSIYSSKTLELKRKFITEDFYVNHSKYLPGYGKECFLCTGLTYSSSIVYISMTSRGMIFIMSFLTGEMIKKIEEQKTNGSSVFLSKTIPNSFYFNAFHSGKRAHPIHLMNYEKEIEVKKSFTIPCFIWRVLPFMNSKNQECCLAAGNSSKMFVFNTLYRLKIYEIKVSYNRPGIYTLLNDQYVIIGKKFTLECFSIKFLEDNLCENENYVPEIVFKKEFVEKLIGRKQSNINISSVKFEIDENDCSFMKFNILQNNGICRVFKVTGLKLEGFLGLAKKDKLERIFYLRNEEFKDLYCKKDPIFVNVKLYNVVLENVLKNLCLK